MGPPRSIGTIVGKEQRKRPTWQVKRERRGVLGLKPVGYEIRWINLCSIILPHSQAPANLFFAKIRKNAE